jgi:hypothetical protein
VSYASALNVLVDAFPACRSCLFPRTSMCRSCAGLTCSQNSFSHMM